MQKQRAKRSSPRLSERDRVRLASENDLETFINLVHPKRLLGNIHKEVIRWWTRQDSKTHQLLLLPRDHMKSALVAYRVAWEITKNPTLRILYISSTSNLATKQLKFIKDILTSDAYRFYWPEMINSEESKREKWTETEISVDHSLRKAEAIRDPSIFTAGLTTSIVGLHCDVSVFDDVVVPDNAYTEEGRTKVETQYSLLASIEGAESRQWVVGTRYDPRDLYQHMMDIRIDQYSDTSGELLGQDPLYEILERQVETRGDGSGEFLWPRQRRADGQWFGFNRDILERKRAQYLDRTQFRAQYYNDPNDISDAPVSPDLFQYYDKNHLKRNNGRWSYKDRVLNIFCAMDFAFSTHKKADFTSIVVIGVDFEHNYFVLDIARFRTNKISDYFEQLMKLYERWGFRKLRAEVSVAQGVIVKELRDNYIRPYGLALSIDEYRPMRNEGHKEERIAAILHPRYENRQIWHYQSGNCQTLEEELVMARPPHDDVKDAFAAAVDIAIAPTGRLSFGARKPRQDSLASQLSHPRFGGISHA